jgi:hypothetical protein
MERRIEKFTKGASTGEPSLAEFGGVVFQGEAKTGKSWRRGGAVGALNGNTRGSRSLVSQGKDPAWSVRPVVGVQTRSARATRPSIVTGATGRGSATAGLAPEGQAGIGRGLSAAVSRSRASDEGEAQRSKTAALRTRGDQPVSGNLKRGTERNGSDGQWSGLLAALEWSGVSVLNRKFH